MNDTQISTSHDRPVGALHAAYMIAGGVALAAWAVHFWRKRK